MAAFQAQPWVESFSAREFEVLQLISNGLSNREIAQKLFLSIETVKWYNKQMFMKLGVKNRIQAVNKAVELDLLEVEHSLPSQEKIPPTGNLPTQLTSYVGREKEIGEVKELLQEHRLVVLTGAGGSGKTRLALKVGEELQPAYRDGVWLVELASIHDPSLVLRTIVKVLDLTERADATPDEILKRYLSRRHLLLLIDNLEHLLECAPQIGDLLASAPGLSVLGTSRECLHIYGEQEYPVYPLDLPDMRAKWNSEDLRNVESIALFIKRARAVKPALSLDEGALRNLARICVRLDGLPLAIELCAPMVKVFPLGEIAEQIEKGLDAIPVGPRNLPARQQTLQGAIQWGYDLLGENEKRLFFRMAVFNGGGTLQALEAICGEGISGNIRNILSSLVNKNLVLAQERGDGEIHFGTLETIRQYARDKLLASDEAEELADRHAGYFMELAKQGAVALRGPDQIIWTERFIAMYGNIRVALKWIIEAGEAEVALRFVNNLFEFWLRTSDHEEALQWHRKTMELPDAQQFPELSLKALNNFSWLCWLQGRINKARTFAEKAIIFSRSQPSTVNTAVALLNLGVILVTEKEIDKAQDFIEEAKNICQENHFEWELARAHMLLGLVYKKQDQYTSARSHFLNAFNLWKKLGDIGFQGVAQRVVGDFEFERGNLNEAVSEYCEALLIEREIKNRWTAACIIWGLARVAKLKGHQVRAIRLYLASKKIFDDIGSWWSEDEIELKDALATARDALKKNEFQSAVGAGEQMTMEEAIEYALSYESDE